MRAPNTPLSNIKSLLTQQEEVDQSSPHLSKWGRCVVTIFGILSTALKSSEQ